MRKLGEPHGLIGDKCQDTSSPSCCQYARQPAKISGGTTRQLSQNIRGAPSQRKRQNVPKQVLGNPQATGHEDRNARWFYTYTTIVSHNGMKYVTFGVHDVREFMQRVAGRMGSNCTTRVHVRVVDDRTGQDSEYVQRLETRRGGDVTRTN